MVDIDKEMITCAKEHLPTFHAGALMTAAQNLLLKTAGNIWSG